MIVIITRALKDQYGEQPAPDPKGPKDGNIKVVRGGSWDRYDVVARVALRLDFYPDIRYRLSGFRLCRYPSG
jgi:sulfatase modifying factor 1